MRIVFNMQNKIAITCGDPAGIGPIVIEKALEALPNMDSSFILIGPDSFIKKFPHISSMATQTQDYVLGEPSLSSSQIAHEALILATEGNFKAIVTAPINKFWMNKVGFKFSGHTEFFENYYQKRATMAFLSKHFRVCLATRHIPLKDVPTKLNPDLLEKTIADMHSFLRRLKINNPRIAVCGLNPHAGENGLLGEEELAWINPLLKKLDLPDAIPADTGFFRYLQGEFDGLVALYHDQGLIPVKTLDFHNAVNISLGLPVLRTSPDHGTAYDRVHNDNISFDSMKNAIQLAVDLTS